MLAQLRMILEADGLDYRKSSNLQGILMERISADYAEELHRQQMHPYSQYLLMEDGKPVWYINTVSREAYEEIICRFMDGPNTFEIRHPYRLQARIQEKNLMVKEKSGLLQDFYNQKANHSIEVEFLTPTAFRQNACYIILPDIRLLCQSLMMKYSVASDQIEMVDEEALQEMSLGCIFSKHRLHSLRFPMEGTTIPGFVGSVTIRCRGTEIMMRYLRLLLQFGEFSGVGIKTAMGMGAMRIRRDDA